MRDANAEAMKRVRVQLKPDILHAIDKKQNVKLHMAAKLKNYYFISSEGLAAHKLIIQIEAIPCL